ncbi:acetylornithine transaminase [bacterium SCSIO 12696]|nr:acetylornithine transaminase [bacterium SCSIO 12696]
MASNALMNNYGTRAITVTKGDGSWLWDDQGNKYLDAISGIAVCGLGHAHPAVTAALSEQAATLVHASNLYNLQPQEQLAEKLRTLSGMDNMFFANSGAEANEAAIKLARLHGNNKGVPVPTIVVMENAFHGRTMATLTATGNPKVQQGFTPCLDGFVRVPFGDADAVEAAVKSNPNIVAVLVEPIQGEGGIHTPSDDYLKQLRTLCDNHDLLLMLDEIQTGNGRTGKYFAYQHADILPDVLTTAKGLGNGVPIGVCMASGKASQLMQPGSHGSTFGGNPLACSVGLAVVDTLQKDNLAERAAQLGEQLQHQLRERLSHCPHFVEVRGKGLMIGIELAHPCAQLVAAATAKGLLITVTAERVIRLLPPLNLKDDEASLLVDTLVNLIEEFAP